MVERLFAGILENDDPQDTALAKGVLEGRFTWLEEGIVEAPHGGH